MLIFFRERRANVDLAVTAVSLDPLVSLENLDHLVLTEMMVPLDIRVRREPRAQLEQQELL